MLKFKKYLPKKCTLKVTKIEIDRVVRQSVFGKEVGAKVGSVGDYILEDNLGTLALHKKGSLDNVTIKAKFIVGKDNIKKFEIFTNPSIITKLEEDIIIHTRIGGDNRKGIEKVAALKGEYLEYAGIEQDKDIFYKITPERLKAGYEGSEDIEDYRAEYKIICESCKAAEEIKIV